MARGLEPPRIEMPDRLGAPRPEKPKRPGVRMGDLLRPEKQSFDLYQSDVGWAQTLEIVSDIPTSGIRATSFEVPSNSSYLLAAVNGLDTDIDILLPDKGWQREAAFFESINTPDHYTYLRDGYPVLGIMKSPPPGRWNVEAVSHGESPFSFHMMTFDEGGLRKEEEAASKMPISWRCRACLVGSKAVGASLGVAAGITAPAVIPAALVSAISAYLGVALPIAGAFIGAVIEESSDGIVQKLCEALRLCERRH
jgi:hypothetical protein